MRFLKKYDIDKNGNYNLLISINSDSNNSVSVILYSDLEDNVVRSCFKIGEHTTRSVFNSFKSLTNKYTFLRKFKDIELYFAYLFERAKYKELVSDINNKIMH